MVWRSPKRDCDCCSDDVCEGKNVTAFCYIDGDGNLAWETSYATSATITAGLGTVYNLPVTGAASESGALNTYDTNDTHTIEAIGICGSNSRTCVPCETVSCGSCNFINVNQTTQQLEFTWCATSTYVPAGLPEETNFIESVIVNGEEQLTEPVWPVDSRPYGRVQPTGTTYYARTCDTASIVVTVTSVCNETDTCTTELLCCYRSGRIVGEFAGFAPTITNTCTRQPVWDTVDWTFDVTLGGLDGLNGTYIDDNETSNFGCLVMPPTIEFFAGLGGTITIAGTSNGASTFGDYTVVFNGTFDFVWNLGRLTLTFTYTSYVWTQTVNGQTISSTIDQAGGFWCGFLDPALPTCCEDLPATFEDFAVGASPSECSTLSNAGQFRRYYLD